MISEGIILSHIRYGAGVYLSDAVRLGPNDKLNANLQKLQVKQNDTMRLILNKKRSDLTPREKLLQDCKMKSVNQMTATAILMEVWRAFKFQVQAITESFVTDRSKRHGITVRTSRNPSSFISVAAKLWNKMNEANTKEVESVTAIKRQIEEVVLMLPIV